MSDNVVIGNASRSRIRLVEFMLRVFDETEGSEAKIIDGCELGDLLVWREVETSMAMRYLEGQGLIRFLIEPPMIGITNKGIVNTEKMLESSGVKFQGNAEWPVFWNR